MQETMPMLHSSFGCDSGIFWMVFSAPPHQFYIAYPWLCWRININAIDHIKSRSEGNLKNRDRKGEDLHEQG